jgi:hypothetical protein
MKYCLYDENGYEIIVFKGNTDERMFNTCEVFEHKINICGECNEQYCSLQKHMCDKYMICEFCDIKFDDINDYENHHRINSYKHSNMMFKKLKDNEKLLNIMFSELKHHGVLLSEK